MNQKPIRRVLIVSSHPLFGQGLRLLLESRPEMDVEVVGVVENIIEAIKVVGSQHVNLIVMDNADETIQRDDILTQLMDGERAVRVVFLTLKERGNEAIVYDRRTMSAFQIDDWLSEWTNID